jgi:hypothetical protein
LVKNATESCESIEYQLSEAKKRLQAALNLKQNESANSN